MSSSLQGPFEPDSQNTDQLIKTAAVNLLGWRFHDSLGIIKSPSSESLKLISRADFTDQKLKNCSGLYNTQNWCNQAETLPKGRSYSYL